MLQCLHVSKGRQYLDSEVKNPSKSVSYISSLFYQKRKATARDQRSELGSCRKISAYQTEMGVLHSNIEIDVFI